MPRKTSTVRRSIRPPDDRRKRIRRGRQKRRPTRGTSIGQSAYPCGRTGAAAPVAYIDRGDGGRDAARRRRRQGLGGRVAVARGPRSGDHRRRRRGRPRRALQPRRADGVARRGRSSAGRDRAVPRLPETPRRTSDDEVAPRARLNRRLILVAALAVLLAAGMVATTGLAVVNARRAADWEDRAEQVQVRTKIINDLLVERSHDLNARTRELNAPPRGCARPGRLRRSEADVRALVRRQTELANEKAGRGPPVGPPGAPAPPAPALRARRDGLRRPRRRRAARRSGRPHPRTDCRCARSPGAPRYAPAAARAGLVRAERAA